MHDNVLWLVRSSQKDTESTVFSNLPTKIGEEPIIDWYTLSVSQPTRLRAKQYYSKPRRPKIESTDIGMRFWPLNEFRSVETSLDGPYPRTSQFGRLQAIRIESRIPKRHTKYDDDQLDRCQLLQSTKAACQRSSPFRQRDECTANFLFAIAQDKTLSEIGSDEHAQMQLAKFDAKIEFCLLQES